MTLETYVPRIQYHNITVKINSGGEEWSKTPSKWITHRVFRSHQIADGMPGKQRGYLALTQK